ncbi:uncharacterized protein LOC129741714 [Uranotaenia lowii]|uniref:uncharacterized protein LOC129741714 n=1 Tax=Uranotaenia lowii TaxID=190385 RepID=UPI0024786C87|nr:uncharacterized protein LOC129741714 [Uranotaenia lowii]XP_055589442.1 uncharacterized protein LOC129741714 [Uranotaenia lowii]XP_055589452.1 uncharacterized protein LOC129741714 [Uranotaenia lowii]
MPPRATGNGSWKTRITRTMLAVVIITGTISQIGQAGPATTENASSTSFNNSFHDRARYDHGHRWHHHRRNEIDEEAASFPELSEEDQHHSNRLHGGGLIRSTRSNGGQQAREPKFISFQTKDNNIEVEIDFAIPFLTIPVKRSIDGVMSSVLQGTPLINVNLGALILAGVLTLGGALVGAVAKLFRDHSFMTPLGPMGIMRSDMDTGSGAASSSDEDKEKFAMLSTLLEAVDKSLQKYDIDSTACTQRAICWYVKEAMNNVSAKRASRMDMVLNGLSSADWAMKFTKGTAVEDAIQVGRKNLNCGQAFPGCTVGPETVQRIMMQNSKKPKEKPKK